MLPNDLGNYLVLENCPQFRIDQFMPYIKDGALSQEADFEGQTVLFTTSPTNFKGQRFWFVCPLCHTKRGVLYKHPFLSILQCRKCLGLNYRQQRYKGMKLS